MTTEELQNLKYPIGKYEFPDDISQSVIENWIQTIEELPGKLNRLIRPLDNEQLDTPYRTDGWTIRQLVHHIADSHMNAILRFKWALTEDTPTIKAYDQDLFAKLDDSLSAPVEFSLDFLSGLHAKWVFLLKSLRTSDFEKKFVHPETGKEISLLWLLGMYAWHSQHHYAHIENILIKKGWK
ncbi:YfiT family bacillithiol transferase [Christiangramia crocea]|uniref:Metal-dependent hydrolase n=1 Tax=Christiangramia crocea TaxID=2904124 RepID=A0A9X2A710_9FLAO|nr:putative metal-dependent hydrolase [Gramella crocea]MCG9971072.1 putative metal-dependent hydrolase [Gramella crocea]